MNGELQERRQQGPRRIRGAVPRVCAAARQLRSAATPAEERLWKAIRKRQLDGLYFRRQHPIGRFIVDFCCTSHRLVVEVDGPTHEGREAYDIARSARLADFGYQVLRFRNEAILAEISSVLEQIRLHVRSQGAAVADDGVNTPSQPPSR